MDEKCGLDLYNYYSTVEDELYGNYTTKMCQLTFLNIDNYLPNNLKRNIKKIIPVYGLGCYFIDNNDRIYVACCQNLLGEGSNGDIPQYGIVDIKETNSSLNDFGKITDVIYNDKINYMPILLTNNTAYSIYYNNLIYRDKELQSSWKKINADNVKVSKFCSLGNSRNSAFLDTNGNLWVAGTNPSIMGIKDVNVINNFIIHPDSMIKEKVKDFCITRNGLFVLTKEGKLYSTGSGAFTGFSTTNDINDTTIIEKLTLLKDDVKSIYTDSDNSLWVVGEDNLYYLGSNWYNPVPIKSEQQLVYITQLTEVMLPEGYSVNNIVKIEKVGTNCSALLVEKDNQRHIFMCGSESTRQSNIGENRLGEEVTTWTELVIKDLAVGEEIYDIELYLDTTLGSGIANSGGYILTKNGSVYAWNYKDLLGIGSTSHENTKIPVSCKITDISQIACGNGWIVLIKNDGSVLGTGSNNFGVLGRWVGSPRGSRYRTAFEWVECPDLEI